MRLFLLAVAAAVALPLGAATSYSVDVDRTGDPLHAPHLHATVLADGAHRRIDIERKETPFTHDVLLSDDGGATFIALNTPLKTWYRAGAASLIGRPNIFGGLPNRKRAVRDVKVTVSDEPSEAVGGFAAHRYVLKTSYAVREGSGAARLDMQFDETAIVTSTDAIDAALAVRLVDLTTAEPEVDAQVVPALAKIAGFPLKTVLTATRVYVGGRPQTLTYSVTVSDIRTVAAPRHAFERPADFIYQEPILGAPGGH